MNLARGAVYDKDDRLRLDLDLEDRLVDLYLEL